MIRHFVVLLLVVYLVTMLIYFNQSALDPTKKDIEYLKISDEKLDTVLQREMRLLDSEIRSSIEDLNDDIAHHVDPVTMMTTPYVRFIKQVTTV